MIEENRKLFFDHAMTETNRETCALLIIEKGRERLVICKNISVANDMFIINPTDYAAAELRGEVVGVVHSHCFISPQPSEGDKVSCSKSNLPWFICSVPTGQWAELKPSGYKAPLVGRTWAHGILDCYALARDYYQEKLGVTVMDFEREYEWWDKGGNRFCEENLYAAGFRQVPIEEVREHDGLLMQIRSNVINHCAVYLGDDQFLHHLHRRLSSRDIWSGYYRKNTIKVVRYMK